MVSGQPIPILIAARSARIAPDEVWLITSSEFKETRYPNLKAVLSGEVKSTNPLSFPTLQVKEIPIGDKQHDLATIKCILKTEIRDYLASHSTDVEFIFNVTCGTKLMSLALVETCREIQANKSLPQAQACYINTSKNEIIFLDKETCEPIDEQPLYTLEEYLRAYDYLYNSDDMKLDGSSFAFDLLNIHKKDPSFFAWINTALSDSYLQNIFPQKAPKKFDLEIKDIDDPNTPQPSAESLEKLNTLLQKYKFSSSCKNGFFHIHSRKERHFLTGRWFELIVFSILQGIAEKPIAQNADIRFNVKTTASKGDTPNELDAVILYKNIAHVLECKSSKKYNTQFTYKISTLCRSLLGLMGKGHIIALNPASPEQHERASRYNRISIFPKATTFDSAYFETALQQHLEQILFGKTS